MNYNSVIDVSIIGISSGFVLGFIAWAIGFVIYSIIKWIRMS